MDWELVSRRLRREMGVMDDFRLKVNEDGDWYSALLVGEDVI